MHLHACAGKLVFPLPAAAPEASAWIIMVSFPLPHRSKVVSESGWGSGGGGRGIRFVPQNINNKIRATENNINGQTNDIHQLTNRPNRLINYYY